MASHGSVNRSHRQPGGAGREGGLVDEGDWRRRVDHCHWFACCASGAGGSCERAAHRSARTFKAIQPALTVISGGLLGSGSCTSLRWVLVRWAVSCCCNLYPLRMTIGLWRPTSCMLSHWRWWPGYLFAGMVDRWMLASLLVGSIPTVPFEACLRGRSLVEVFRLPWPWFWLRRHQYWSDLRSTADDSRVSVAEQAIEAMRGAAEFEDYEKSWLDCLHYLDRVGTSLRNITRMANQQVPSHARQTRKRMARYYRIDARAQRCR